MTDSMDVLIGVVCLIFGVYCLYAYAVMKKTGVINTTILMPKSVRPEKCKDKEAYLKRMLPKVLMLGIMLILYSGVELLNYFYMKNTSVAFTALAVFTLVLIWFGYSVSRAAKQYF